MHGSSARTFRCTGAGLHRPRPVMPGTSGLPPPVVETTTAPLGRISKASMFSDPAVRPTSSPSKNTRPRAGVVLDDVAVLDRARRRARWSRRRRTRRRRCRCRRRRSASTFAPPPSPAAVASKTRRERRAVPEVDVGVVGIRDAGHGEVARGREEQALRAAAGLLVGADVPRRAVRSPVAVEVVARREHGEGAAGARVHRGASRP